MPEDSQMRYKKTIRENVPPTYKLEDAVVPNIVSIQCRTSRILLSRTREQYYSTNHRFVRINPFHTKRKHKSLGDLVVAEAVSIDLRD